MTKHHIIIVDDHPLFRDALKQTLETSFNGLIVSECGSIEQLGAAIEASEDIDLVLLDLSMPGVHGYSGLVYLRAQAPHVPIVVVSGNENPSVIRRCLEFGASGFIPKSLAVNAMGDAIKAVLDGKIWLPPDFKPEDARNETPDDLAARLSTLTPQQIRVLMMLGEGLLNKQIAYHLNVSEATIKAHVSAILHKLGVDSRTQAVIAVNKIDNLEAFDQTKTS
jgi:DNA-binding NarL/FixJ family response regulator